MQAGRPQAAAGRPGRSAQREALQSRSTIATFVQTILSMAKSSKKSFQGECGRLCGVVRNRSAEAVRAGLSADGRGALFYRYRWPNGSATTILSPEERAFDQTVVYGRDTEAGADRQPVPSDADDRGLPGGDRPRSADACAGLDQLSLYTSAPSPTTILVLCHKEKGHR